MARPRRVDHLEWVARNHPGEWVVYPDVNPGATKQSCDGALRRLPGWRAERAVRNTHYLEGKSAQVGDYYVRFSPPSGEE